MEHFQWYFDFETVLMGYLANFLPEAFVAQRPSGSSCRCEERMGYSPRADVCLLNEDTSRRLCT